MAGKFKDRLENLPVVKWVIRLMHEIKPRSFEGLSLYDLFQMYFLGIVNGALSTRASSIAFSLFMALFPLLIFLLTLLPFVIPYVSVGETDFDTQFLGFLNSFLPEATGEYFSDIYRQIKDQKHGGLLSSSFLISIILMTNGVSAIFEGFDISYHIELTRNFFKQYAYALMVGLILSILLLIGAVAYVYFQFYILENLSEWAAKARGKNMTEYDILGARIGQFLFFGILSYLTTAFLYYFGTTNRKKARFFSHGAFMTTILFIITSYLFGIYVDEFARYNELYGALGGLLILMFYIWLNSIILLLGFELNATIAKLRKKGKQKKATADVNLR